ncbi:MAG: DUF2865 domain-containing protein [Pseudomonadota bacterium]
MRSVLRSTLVAAFAAVLTAGTPLIAQSPANAQSCSALKAQLAAASRVGNSTQYRRYDNALSTQQRELSRASSLYRSSCSNSALNAQCRNLSATIRQMRANIVKLQGQRDRFASRRLSNVEQRRLEAQIDRACSGRNVTVVARRGDTPRPAIQDVSPRRPSTNTPRTVEPLMPDPRHRTLCVREVDGYYFPISFASREESFPRDAAICQAICPAQDVKLFTHPAGDDAGVDTMVSLQGEAYAEQPYAFAYRSKPMADRRACGAPDLAKLRELGYIQAGDQVTGTQAAKEKTVQYPTVKNRPDPFSDPETRTNVKAKLNPAKIKKLLNQTSVGKPVEISNAPTNIRVVLPELLPDPATAIDLAAPAPTAVR